MNIMNDLSWVPALRTPELNVFFDWVTLIGYPLFLILFLLFGYFFFRTKSFYQATILLIGAGLINLLFLTKLEITKLKYNMPCEKMVK